MKTSTKQLLRSLPSISTLLEHEEVVDWLNGLPRSSVVSALQSSLDAARRAILGVLGRRWTAPCPRGCTCILCMLH